VTLSAGVTYDSGNSFSESEYFSIPNFDSHEEIATQFVAPFLFVTILLHFALSRVFTFILAEDVEDNRYNRVPAGIPLVWRPGHSRPTPDARKYSMIMSITITASLIPTPYWGWITGLMSYLGLSAALFFSGLFLYIMYMMVK
jgi:hypothetical protein